MEYLSHVPEVKDTVDKQSLLNHLCTYVVDHFLDSTDLFSEIPAISRAAKVAYCAIMHSDQLKRLELVVVVVVVVVV